MHDYRVVFENDDRAPLTITALTVLEKGASYWFLDSNPSRFPLDGIMPLAVVPITQVAFIEKVQRADDRS